MRRIQALIFRAFVSLFLCAAPFAAGPCLAVYHPMDGEIVLAQSGEISSTADEAQQRWIRQLAQSGREGRDLAPVTVDYPLVDSVFPPEIIPPTFLWHDAADGADRWLVDVAYGEGPIHLYVLVPGLPPSQGEIDPMALSSTNEVYQPTPYQASARSWKPSAELWQVIKDRSAAEPLTVTLHGFNGDAQPRALRRAADAARPPRATGVIKPLARRRGAADQLAPEAISGGMTSRVMLQGHAHLRQLPQLLRRRQDDGHGRRRSPTATREPTRLPPVEPEHGHRQRAGDHLERLRGQAAEGHITLGFLSRISPDGRHVVSTVNEADLRGGTSCDYRFGQVFYPTRGILAVLRSAETGEIKALPGADDPDYVHCNAVWTPDGKTIVFARGRGEGPLRPKGRPLATLRRRSERDPDAVRPLPHPVQRRPRRERRSRSPAPRPTA